MSLGFLVSMLTRGKISSPPPKRIISIENTFCNNCFSGDMLVLGGCTVYPYPAMEKGTLGDVPLPC